jgi:hypothetical protein
MAEHVIVKLILWDSREAIVSVDPDAKRPQVKLKVAGTETWLDTTDVPANRQSNRADRRIDQTSRKMTCRHRCR